MDGIHVRGDLQEALAATARALQRDDEAIVRAVLPAMAAAVARDREALRLAGVRPSRVRSLRWALPLACRRVGATASLGTFNRHPELEFVEVVEKALARLRRLAADGVESAAALEDDSAPPGADVAAERVDPDPPPSEGLVRVLAIAPSAPPARPGAPTSVDVEALGVRAA